MKRKNVNTILIVILLTLNIFGLITYRAESKTWTVDDDGPADFHTIQEAINAASTGDTIVVAIGTYPEYVCVNKSITLKGTNRQSIITGVATLPRVVDVKVGSVALIGNVKISGFTINPPKATIKGIYVEPPLNKYFTNINITDNTVIGCNDGIFYSRSSKCFVTNNTLQGNTYGIRLYDSNYNTVAENFVNGSTYYGITFYARSKYNNITQNTLTKNKYCVLLEYANSTTMYLNMIESNTEYGIRLSYTFNSLIKGNTIKNNKYGVYIWNCSQNQFYYNNFIDNTIQVEHYAAPLTSNTWDTNVPPPGRAKGNYWSDYKGVDDGSGTGRWGEGRYLGDGIGDTLIPHLGLDWYPLMYPWVPIPPTHPVAVFTWSPPEPIINQITTFNASKSYVINSTIMNYTWNFHDGTPIVTESDPIIIHVFTVPGNYTVTLTVTDNNGATNSTSHFVNVLPYKLEIDVFTQHPEPYSGRGPHQPSDAYAPQSLVILYAEVTYNYEPLDYKPVSFAVTDPNNNTVVDRSAFTNASGIATVSFRLATNATFGTYRVLATVSVSEKEANDTLTFLMGWLIEIIKVETLNQNGEPKSTFARDEQVYFSIDIKNIAFTSKNATLTVSLRDPSYQLIGATSIKVTVPPSAHEYNLIFNLLIPKWALVGPEATAYVNAFTTWPWSGGVPYCPEKSISFTITQS